MVVKANLYIHALLRIIHSYHFLRNQFFLCYWSFQLLSTFDFFCYVKLDYVCILSYTLSLMIRSYTEPKKTIDEMLDFWRHKVGNILLFNPWSSVLLTFALPSHSSTMVLSDWCVAWGSRIFCFVLFVCLIAFFLILLCIFLLSETLLKSLAYTTNL